MVSAILFLSSALASQSLYLQISILSSYTPLSPPSLSPVYLFLPSLHISISISQPCLPPPPPPYLPVSAFLYSPLPSPPCRQIPFSGQSGGGEAAASVYSSALIGPMTRSSVIGRPSGGEGPRGTAREGEGLELPGQYLTGPLLAAIQASRRVDSLPLPPLSPSSDFQELFVVPVGHCLSLDHD
jgi:hypothetical protein